MRYYESLGLIEPLRLSKGYRDYIEGHVRMVIEVRELASTGIITRQAAPLVECLRLGHQHGDDCVSSLAAYRDDITEIDRIIATLQARRAQLVQCLDESASRAFTKDKPLSDYKICLRTSRHQPTTEPPTNCPDWRCPCQPVKTAGQNGATSSQGGR
ncbi:MerR family transcriptional regulator [Microbacterium maritypicum]|uniref:hypothetical protein n=1 Tax=Microbacterium maritypicum TaxID=33918 RepID=UPI00381D4749